MPEILSQVNELKELDDIFQKILDEFPEERRRYHEEMAMEAKEILDSKIESSIYDEHGHVRSWQEQHVGTGGGYAAVRPQKGSTGSDSPGAITNYLENGHKIRPPSGNNPNYKPKINVPYVSGYHFYQQAQAEVEARTVKKAEDFVDQLAAKLGG